jgi:hypothetical protein
MDPISAFVMTHVIESLAHIILPMMLGMFTLAIVFRMLIFYTARAELAFAREFEKRVFHYFSEAGAEKEGSFYILLRYFLEKTYFDVFEMRRRHRRRHLDHVTSVSDRLFMIEAGMFRAVQDSLLRARYIRRPNAETDPKLMELSKNVFESNPVFNRIFGVIPIGPVNDLMNILPGLLIIGGIFGTFLGIAKGIPELGSMNLSDAAQSKVIMDAFLVKISQAMIKSIIGIGLSVLMSLVNTLLSPELTVYSMITKYTATLDRVWNETKTNAVLPNELPLTEVPSVAPALPDLMPAAQGTAVNGATPPPPPVLRSVG